MRKATRIALLALVGLGWAGTSARGAISATSTISSQQLSPTSYQYSLTLTNTGTTNIGTLWFAWFPLYDLLTSAPTGSTSPSGWTFANAPDFFGTASAQWVNTTTPLTPGQTLSGFSFTSSETPAQIGGISAFFGVPVEQTYVYIGAPQTDPGAALVPTTVAATPEPGALAMLLGLPALLVRRKRR